MLQFSCPTCKSKLQVPDAAASTKMLCQVCGQKLLVPKLPSPTIVNRTVIGKLESVLPDPPPEAAPPLAAPVELPPQRAGVPRWVFLSGAAAGALILLLVVILISSLGGRSGNQNTAVADPKNKTDAKQQNGEDALPDKSDTRPRPKDATPKPPTNAGGPKPADKLPSADPVAESLASTDPAKQKEVLKKLAEDTAAGKKHLKQVCEAMANGPQEVRQAGIEVLQKVQPELVGPIITILVDGDAYRRIDAVQKLAAMGGGAKAALPVLIGQLRKLKQQADVKKFYNLEERQLLLTAMHQIDQNDDEVIDTIIVSLQGIGSYPYTYGTNGTIAAAQLLGKTTGAPPKSREKIVAKLHEKLKNMQTASSDFDTGYVCKELILALGCFGSDAKVALPAIQAFRFHANQGVRDAAEQVIKSIGP